MAKFIDLTEKSFNKLTVIKRVENNKYNTAQWLCKCGYCGGECIRTSSQLRANKVASCGCMKKELHKSKIKKYNEYIVNKNKTVTVLFSNSDKTFICDLDDWELAKNYNWALHHTGYAYTTVDSKYTTFHDFVMNNKDRKLQIDHKNINPLDNTKNNLRIVTRSQNMMNRNILKNNTSGYKGISLNKATGRWIARIGINGKRISLGTYDDIKDAIKIREEAELKYFGEYMPQK